MTSFPSHMTYSLDAKLRHLHPLKDELCFTVGLFVCAKINVLGKRLGNKLDLEFYIYYVYFIYLFYGLLKQVSSSITEFVVLEVNMIGFSW